jgi:acetylornithine deacetylase
MEAPLLERLFTTAQNNESRYVDFLQALLKIPTPRMSEHECVRFLADALEQSGLSVTSFPGLGLAEPLPDGLPLNLVCTRTGTGSGRSLMIEAHIDTVPPGDDKKWHSPPWSAEIRDGKIYARGAHDDRVGAAMIWMLHDLLDQCGIKTKGDLHFLVTTEEEFSSGGMKAFLTNPKKVIPDAHIGLDGNRAHYCITGHAGALPFEVVFEGPWGSVLLSDTEQESNPIVWASRLVSELPRFAESTVKRFRDRNPDPRWPDPTVVATAIHTRDWVSNLPEECTVRVFANVMPPVTLDEFKGWVLDFVRDFATGNPWLLEHPPRVHWLPPEVPAYVLPENSEFLNELSRCHEQAFGVPLQARYIGGWGDMRLLESPEIVLYGPGGGGGDHSYNEYFELSSLVPTLVTLGTLTARWCGLEP